MKRLESCKCFKPAVSQYFASYGSLAYKKTISIPGWRLIKLNNEFIFPCPEKRLQLLIFRIDYQEFVVSLD